MKISKKLKYLLPITITGAGLTAASVISTQKLLGIKEMRANLAYNIPSKTTQIVDVPHPENPPQKPGETSEWINLHYEQWSPLVQETDMMWKYTQKLFTNVSNPSIRMTNMGDPRTYWHHSDYLTDNESRTGHMLEVRKRSLPTVTGKSKADDNVISMWYNMDSPIVGVQGVNLNEPKRYSSFGPYHESIPIKTDNSSHAEDAWSRSFRGSTFNITSWNFDKERGGASRKHLPNIANHLYLRNGFNKDDMLHDSKVGKDIMSLNNYYLNPHVYEIIGSEGNYYYNPEVNSNFNLNLGSSGAEPIVGVTQFQFQYVAKAGGSWMSNGPLMHPEWGAFNLVAPDRERLRWGFKSRAHETNNSYARLEMNQPDKMSDKDFLSFSSKFYFPREDWSLLQCSILGQFIFSYDSYYDKNISIYVAKDHWSNNTGIEDNPSARAYTYYDADEITNYYPSQVLNNPHMLKRKLFEIKYRYLPMQYFNSVVKCQFNDDLGTLTFNFKIPFLSAYQRSFNQTDGYVADWIDNGGTNEYQFVIHGFKKNNTVFTSTELEFHNASKIVASDVITEEILKRELWRQLTDGYKYTNGAYRNDEKIPDKIINNWDRIPGFRIDNIKFVGRTLYNIEEGQIKTNIKLTKWIDANGNIKEGDGFKAIPFTFFNFAKVQGKTRLAKPIIDIGRNKSLGILSDINNKYEGIKIIESMLYDHQQSFAFDWNNEVFRNMDEVLLNQKPFKVIDYIPNPTNGSIDVFIALEKIYDPSIDNETIITLNKPIVERLRITGFRGKNTKVFFNNTTTRLVSNDYLISQTELGSADFAKGIEIRATKLNSETANEFERDIKGYAQDILSMYYVPLFNRYIALVVDEATGSLAVATNTDPCNFMKDSDDIKYLNDEMEGDGLVIQPSLLTSMRMVPLNNSTGVPNSFIAFPTMGSGVTKNNDQSYYISFNKRGILEAKKIPYGTLLPLKPGESIYDYKSIISLGGFDNLDGTIHLNYAVANGISDIELKSIDLETNDIGELSLIPDSSYSSNPLPQNRIENEVMMLNLNDGYSISEMMMYKNENIMNYYQANMPTIKLNDGTYSSVFTRLLPTKKAGNLSYQPYVFDVINNSEKSTYLDPKIGQEKDTKISKTKDQISINLSPLNIVSDATISLTNPSSLFAPNGVENVYSSNSQRYMIYNVKSKSNVDIPLEYRSKSFAYIYDIYTKQKYIIKIGDTNKNVPIAGATTDFNENAIVMPDQSGPNKYKVINFDRDPNEIPNAVQKASDLSTKVKKTEIHRSANIYHNYEWYQTNKNNFIEKAILPHIKKNIVMNALGKDLLSDSNEFVIGDLSWNFDKGTLDVPVTILGTVRDSLITVPETIIFSFIYNNLNEVTSIRPTSRWNDVNLVDLEMVLRSMNNAKNYDSYFILDSSLNQEFTTPPEITRVEIESVDKNVETAILTVIVDKALVDVNGNIEVINNYPINVNISLNKTNVKLPDNLDIGINALLRDYPPSEFVRLINGEGSKAEQDTLIKEVANELIAAIGKDKLIKPADIVIKPNHYFNNSEGSVNLAVSIPKLVNLESDKISEFLEHEIVLNGFKKYPPTLVNVVDMEIIKKRFPKIGALTPSKLQDYINSNWYNIYKFITISNSFGGPQPWHAWIEVDDGTGATKVIPNPDFDEAKLEKYSSEEIDKITQNNTTILAKVQKPTEDYNGQARLNIFIKNGFSKEPNTALLKKGNKYVPYSESISTQEVVIDGLAYASTGIETRFDEKIVLNAINHSEFLNVASYFVLEHEASMQKIIDKVIKPNAHNLPMDAKIEVVGSSANNRDGMLMLEIKPDRIKVFGKEVDNIVSGTTKPMITYHISIEGFKTITSPTIVDIHNTTVPIDLNFNHILHRLFNEDGTLNQDNGANILSQFIKISNSPNVSLEKNIELGSICNINYEESLATIKFRLKDYYDNDQLISLRHGMEVSIDIFFNSTGIYVLSIEKEYTSDNKLIHDKHYSMVYDAMVQKQLHKLDTLQKQNCIILITSLISLSVIFAILLIIYRKKHLPNTQEYNSID